MKNRYLLAFLLGVLSLNAFGGSWSILSDVSGGNLKMTPANLAGSPFDDFTVPGLTLLLLFGIGPLFLIYGVLKKTSWAKQGVLLIGAVLLIWLFIQYLIIGYHWMQTATAMLAAIIILAAIPKEQTI